jgi:hypothetical protein
VIREEKRKELRKNIRNSFRVRTHNHLSFVLKQKKEAKKNSRLTFFSYSLPALR